MCLRMGLDFAGSLDRSRKLLFKLGRVLVLLCLTRNDLAPKHQFLAVVATTENLIL